VQSRTRTSRDDTGISELCQQRPSVRRRQNLIPRFRRDGVGTDRADVKFSPRRKDKDRCDGIARDRRVSPDPSESRMRVSSSAEPFDAMLRGVITRATFNNSKPRDPPTDAASLLLALCTLGTVTSQHSNVGGLGSPSERDRPARCV
jgi:hypothetical protein